MVNSGAGGRRLSLRSRSTNTCLQNFFSAASCWSVRRWKPWNMNGVSVQGRSSSATYMPNSSSATVTCLRSIEGEVYPPLLDRVAGDGVDDGGALGAAALVRVRAAGMEGASRRRRERIGHLAGHRDARPAGHAEVGHRVEQHA